MKRKRSFEGLRDVRKATGLTLEQAARALGTTGGELSRYERAERRLPARLVGPMAALYNGPGHPVVADDILAANARDWLRREAESPTPKRPRRNARTKEAAS